MTFKVRIGGVWKSVLPANVVRVRVGGVWKIVERIRIRQTNAGTVGWREFYVKAAATPPPTPPPTPEPPPPPPPVTLVITLSPNYAHKGSFNPGTLITGPVTATPTNGTGPYTYQWNLISWTHPTLVPSATAPTSATTGFRQTINETEAEHEATFRVIVTDSLGNTGTKDITATFVIAQRPSAGGGGGGVIP